MDGSSMSIASNSQITYWSQSGIEKRQILNKIFF
jgi:hypothetical protein